MTILHDVSKIYNQLEEITERLQEVLLQKPTHGGTQEDVYWLNGKKDLAEELLKILMSDSKKT